MERLQWMAAAMAVLSIGPFLGGGVGVTIASASSTGIFHAPLFHAPAAASAGSPFAFVSNFENRGMGNWTAVSGTASVVTTPNYLGEPALSSTGSPTSVQADQATRGFVPGDASLSFQAEVYYGTSPGADGFIGLLGPHGEVAVVGVHGASVWAGSTVASAVNIGPVPKGTAQPSGWVDLLAYVFSTTTPSGTNWSMDVYVDRTDVVAASNLSVPNAGNYLGAEILTDGGTVLYTNIDFTSYQIPTTIPGYNNMDGYGQGSGLLVTTLPRFTTLTSEMTLSNWTIPQGGILSFQINAMNRIGTTQNTCFGFYQLGVDLDPSGHIAPWFVPNNNCVAYYFNSHNTPKISGGFSSPAGTRLTLRIVADLAAAQIDFEIIDHSITGANHTVQVTIPYNGSAFEGAYTQVEWQPCCSATPIGSYFFNGSMSELTISGGNLPAPTGLPAWYMVPFALDVPPSWNYGFYDQAAAGYAQAA